ncbi:MAG: AAA family ATPase [Catenulispora sp.]|nr:AAA family ATPase [Catenulispora sp.]
MAEYAPVGTLTRGVPLAGRHEELRVLAELQAGVRDGMSAALILYGEAGIGKTRLLDHLAETSTDLRVVRTAGVESEARLGFAALHRLLQPFLGGLEALPPPQREALGSAFGLLGGPPADRYLVGMATLTLLADASAIQPLLCLVDDVQWLDRESCDALAFVGRRLGADAVGLVIAGREGLFASEAFDGFGTLSVRGLNDVDAHELLGRNVAGRLDVVVADRVVADSGGNPLALIETANALTPAHLAGQAPLLEPLPVGSRLENHFGRLIHSLPQQTQTFLIVLSVVPQGDMPLLWRAAGELGIPAEAVDAAVSAGIIDDHDLIEFRHPLIRSAVYRGADAAERRRVHAALAAASDPVRSPEHRAWHRAKATIGLDDAVADELNAASELAGARGGYATRAALLARAAELSVTDRAVRLVEAARAHLLLGDPATAQRMLEQAEPLVAAGDPTLRARALHAKATTDIYFERVVGSLSLLVAAADMVATTDPALARNMLVEGLLASLFGDHGTIAPAEFGRVVLSSPAMRISVPTGTDLLLQGFALRLDGGYASAAPVLHKALETLGREGDVVVHAARPAVLALYASQEVWDEVGGDETVGLLEAQQRASGALGALGLTLVCRASCELRAGRFEVATASLDEAEILCAVIGEQSPGAAYRVELLSWQGQEAEARAAADLLVRDWEAPHAHGGLGHWARNCLTVLELGLGRYADAAAYAGSAFASDIPAVTARAAPDLLEAAVRCGDEHTAKEALRLLEERAPLAGTPWALGLLARCRGLMSDGDDAEVFYQESVAQLGRTHVRTDLARTHLLYGEWLRRRRRRADARVQLRIAHEMFVSMGAAAFAERTRLELLATGESARRRTVQTTYDLTPQERRIAVLAAEGATNGEIATRLFITQSTVEYHLNKVFRKLAITSRRQLRKVLQEQG